MYIIVPTFSFSFTPPPAHTHTLSLCVHVGVTVEPHRRQLHVTLAHQYLPEHHATLEDLARSKVDPQAPTRWELRLYSRDHRLALSEVTLYTSVETAYIHTVHVQYISGIKTH